MGRDGHRAARHRVGREEAGARRDLQGDGPARLPGRPAGHALPDAVHRHVGRVGAAREVGPLPRDDRDGRAVARRVGRLRVERHRRLRHRLPAPRQVWQRAAGQAGAAGDPERRQAHLPGHHGARRRQRRGQPHVRGQAERGRQALHRQWREEVDHQRHLVRLLHDGGADGRAGHEWC